MTATQLAVRAGFARGWIECRNYFRSRDELYWNVFLAAVFAVVLFLQRNSVVESTDQSLASVVLPGILGMTMAWGGLSGAAGILAIEREDGTLLRAKAVPRGMVGYVVAKVVMTAVTSAVTVVIILVAGLLFVRELVSTPWTGWLMMIVVLALALLATMPWGAIIGSLVKSPQAAFGLTFLPMGVLTAISGIFYPITALPGWVQSIAQLFPDLLGWPRDACRPPAGGRGGRDRRFVAIPRDVRCARRVGGSGLAAGAAYPAQNGAARIRFGRRGAAASGDAAVRLGMRR